MQVTGTFPELSAGRSKGKVAKVMHEFKHKALHSGSKKGPKVTSRKQAIAIALSEERNEKKGGIGGFAVSGRVRPQAKRPTTFAARRAASHDKAYPKK